MLKQFLYFVISVSGIQFLNAQDSDEEDDVIYVTEPYSMEAKSLDCIDVVRTDGDLTFQETRDNSETVCGTFFSGDINDVISIEVIDANVNCDKGEVLEIFDGWITQHGMLPNEHDHEVALKDRVVDYCSWVKAEPNSLSFVSSQNFALVQYHLRQNSFVTLRFRKLHRDEPRCHVLAPFSEGVHTMRSMGGCNCTFSILEPTNLLIKEIKLGSPHEKNNSKNIVEILNGESLDTSKLNTVHQYSSPLHSKKVKEFSLVKSHTAVRMTSSDGSHNNIVAIRYSKLQPDPKACHQP